MMNLKFSSRNLVLALGTVLFLSSCSNPCGFALSSSSTKCHALTSNLSVRQISGFGSCSGATNSRKVQISCAPGSGSNSTCTSRSNGSGYFVIVVPNNNGGSFLDSNYGLISDCNTLWNAINGVPGSRPTDVLGIYHGDQSLGDNVSCTDGGGCAVTSPNCFSGWDTVNQQASGSAVTIANGSYLGCAFIDSPWADGITPAQGAPPTPGPPAGLVGTSVSSAFKTFTFTSPSTTPILLNSWVDY